MNTLKVTQLQRLAQATGIKSSGPKPVLAARLAAELGRVRSCSRDESQGLTRYRPTHLLIERQRFRSGGASAVQEWSLRVGVFEGMLHAVLFTLGRQLKTPPVVVGVEPRRVGRYWELVRGVSSLEHGKGVEKVKGEEGEKKKKKKSAKEGKKVKIALVGGWLEAACSSASASSASLGDISSIAASSSVTSAGHTGVASCSEPGWGASTSASASTPTPAETTTNTPTDTPTTTTTDDTRLSLQIPSTPSPALQKTITAYLAKWHGSPRTRKKTPTRSEMADGTAGGQRGDTDKDVDKEEEPNVEIESGIEIGKLDDLADCLVQGVTWLEWRAMRERVVREGVPEEFR
ncbi:uncharacterized protein BDW47DRAFT_129079 [Aspergillus candidus]|uniref:Mitochondrial resolvase Ydc2 n=1 Tax=Aspergillus candidus TaxID=41067 RepID=A0A2I2F1F3_ASPCN|nr:mitochondrial resolvase Ydc2 [Aspergillus candidus]PLB34449.1 mitochondrial resolvase Ydc2 [Aspergillus candidus]